MMQARHWLSCGEGTSPLNEVAPNPLHRDDPGQGYCLSEYDACGGMYLKNLKRGIVHMIVWKGKSMSR